MNVLSLFDGISSGMVALKRANITVSNYYASEIDKFAIKVSQDNHSNIVQMGNILDWESWELDWSSIDLVFAGFPCQAWSVAGKQQGDKDERGKLFWIMLEVMKKVRASNPDFNFLIENVKMKRKFEEYITFHCEEALGVVHKTLINSALVSAQNRNRYYWTSFPIHQPEDRGVFLKDIIEAEPQQVTLMSESFKARNAKILRDDLSGKARSFSAMEYLKNGRHGDYIIHPNNAVSVSVGSSENRTIRETEKLSCLTASYFKGLRAAGRPFIATPQCVGRHIDECVNVSNAPKAGAIRARPMLNGKRADNHPEAVTQRFIELREDNKSNSLTTLTKDNIVVHDNDKNYSDESKKRILKNTRDIEGKAASICLNSNFTGSGVNLLTDDTVNYRKLTPIECERLQTFDDGYTKAVSNSQRYKSLGNAWTVEVIVHILKCKF